MKDELGEICKSAEDIWDKVFNVRVKHSIEIGKASNEAAKRALQCAAELVINYPIGKEPVDFRDIEARILNLKELNWSEE